LEYLPIDSIPEHYLVSVLRKFYDSGVKESARRARAVAAQIFSYAKATHRGTNNPARDMSDNPYFKKPSVNHFKALPKSEVAALMVELNKKGSEQTLDAKTICALKMAIYTGLRDNSIRGARWAEIDLKQGIWTVPSERMKSGRLHIVSLPKQAVLALTELKPLTYRNDDSYVFPGAGKNRFMAENTLRLALHRIGFKVTVHGMRSLITDVLHENGYASEVIERQLDHADTNKVRKAYLRSDFMDKRILMMQWFADWCDAGSAVKGGAE
jgi:integrase